MKLERISANQIRCTLTREDLDERGLKINELAYGTEKAKALFRDMMEQASLELGFEADHVPLVIEAIPVSPDCVLLNVTRVTEPDELDMRFSQFTPNEDILQIAEEAMKHSGKTLSPEDADAAEYDESFDEEPSSISDHESVTTPSPSKTSPEKDNTIQANEPFMNMGEEILEHFNQFLNQKFETTETESEQSDTPETSVLDHLKQLFSDIDTDDSSDLANTSDSVDNETKEEAIRYIFFEFSELNAVIQFAKALPDDFKCENTLYRIKDSKTFMLILSNKDMASSDFKHLYYMGCEYGTPKKGNMFTPYYYREHHELIRSDCALQFLKQF